MKTSYSLWYCAVFFVGFIFSPVFCDTKSEEDVLVITTTTSPVLSDEVEAETSVPGSAESWEHDNNVNSNNNMLGGPDLLAEKDQSALGTSDIRARDEKRQEVTTKPEIYSFRVQSDIRYRYSRTYVTSRVANRDPHKSQEVTFRVVLPETAFISKFIMEIDGKAYEAYVKGKEEAKKVYNEAQSQGQSAGLVELNTRNSNVFNVNVNIKAQSKVNFNLTYEELLSRRLGRYEQTINISPDQVTNVKDFQILVNIEESQNITFLRVPNLRNDIEAHEDPEGNNKDAIITRPAGNKANITWSPTAADQAALSKQGIIGKFVVQYDINRDTNAGEILVMEGYFVHFFAPENLKPLRKHVVFILDVSGSMWGRKMEQLKESQKKILDDLNTEDFFNIITFSSDVFLWSPNDAVPQDPNSHWSPPQFHGETTPAPVRSEEDKKQPFPATKENIEKAKKFIDSLVASGGTNIHDAIMEALNLTIAIKNARDGIVTNTTTTTESPPEPLPTALPLEENTTTVVLDEAETTFSPLRSNLPAVVTKSDSSVSVPKIILPPNVESLIIFLTDGEPTVGISNPISIQQLIQAANKNSTVPLFSLAFGEGADFSFVRKLSLQNYGFARKIYEASDAALQLKGFYNEIASPLLSNVTFNYTSPEYNVTDVTLTKFPTIFGGTEVAVAGRIVPLPKPEETASTDQPTEASTDQMAMESVANETAPTRTLIDNELVLTDKYYFDVFVVGSGRDGVIDFTNPEIFSRPIPWGIPEIVPFPPRPTPPPSQEDQFLERLWAYLTIQQLIERDLAVIETESDNNIPDNDIQIKPTAATSPATVTLTSVLPELSDNKTVTTNQTAVKKETPKEQALRLALKYGFVTPLTSLVVVKPNSSDITNASPGDAKPELADSLSAPQSMAVFAIARPPMAHSKIKFSVASLTANRIGGGGNANYALLPLSLSQAHYGQNNFAALPGPPGFQVPIPGFFVPPQSFHTIDPTHGFNQPPKSPQFPYAIQNSPPRIQHRTTTYKPQSQSTQSPSTQVVEEEEPEQVTLQPSFSIDEESSTSTDGLPSALTLQDLKWFNTDSPILNVNQTDYTIRQNQTESTTEGDECSVSTTGVKGQCSHLKDCVQAAFVNDVELYRKSYFCPINSRSENVLYAGACCPRTKRSLHITEDP